ncbi:uncharacterized protein LOC131143476 [Malania oleifera]|uniref:uncharacterized protein LOC131143476 n=1 Tax=Malania oleifera TaxID=397392 RepID=UPI0025ADB938|nr:uncharacterized protein LOC131143476 [Malania oleifera]
MEKIERMEAHEGKKDKVYTILFMAGTALLMFGLKMCLVEQWRAWVFLTLNLLLLAILLTSVQFSSEEEKQESTEKEITVESKKVNVAIIQQSSTTATKKASQECHDRSEEAREPNLHCELDDSSRGGKQSQVEDDEEQQQFQLSKEELHERVEAFIAMFRRHLVLDAQRGSGQVFSSTRSSYNVVCC